MRLGVTGLVLASAVGVGAQTLRTTQHFAAEVLRRMSVERNNVELQVGVQPFKRENDPKFELPEQACNGGERNSAHMTR